MMKLRKVIAAVGTDKNGFTWTQHAITAMCERDLKVDPLPVMWSPGFPGRDEEVQVGKITMLQNIGQYILATIELDEPQVGMPDIPAVVDKYVFRVHVDDGDVQTAEGQRRVVRAHAGKVYALTNQMDGMPHCNQHIPPK